MGNVVDKVPTTDQYRPAVLKFLSDGIERSLSEITQGASDVLGVSEAARQEILCPPAP